MQYDDMLYFNDACGHVFHEECMIRAVQAIGGAEHFCPFCKSQLPEEDVVRLSRDRAADFDDAINKKNLKVIKAIVTAPRYDINKLQYWQEFEYDAYSGQSFTAVTALMYAIAHSGTPEIIGLLLSVPGIDVRITDSRGRNALWYAAYGISEQNVQMLIYAGSDVNSRDIDGKTALMNACDIGEVRDACRFEIVEILLATPGIDVNAVSKTGDTALSTLCDYHDDEGSVKSLMKLLTVNGIKINASTNEKPALVNACSVDATMKAKILLDVDGIDANLGLDDRTPLHLACINFNFEIMKAILKKDGINVNGQEGVGDGNTPLINLVSSYTNSDWFVIRTECVKLLVSDPRTNIGAVNKKGKTAFDVVRDSIYLQPEEKKELTRLLNEAALNRSQWAGRLRAR
jgi:ankyrin repeat protein